MARDPRKFKILIGVNSNREFTYKELYSGNDASSLTVVNGDQITWVLDLAIPERAFQLDFDIINPFQLFRTVSLRDHGHIAAETVNFPRGYVGNRQLKYSVTLGNGWHDDPVVVPVENDGGIRGALALASNVLIQWADLQYMNIVLNPASYTTSSGGGNIPITWNWNVGPNDPTPPFSLLFTNPPNGWPNTEQDSDPAITLSLPAGSSPYTITTMSGVGGQIQKSGTLTIT